MSICTMVLFGEAEKGEFQKGYSCQTLPQLADFLGNPPKNSLGLYFAIQALLFKRKIIFFRVKEEGYSLNDYFAGMQQLLTFRELTRLEAVGIPGVGNHEIIQALNPICHRYHSILCITEMDFFDYMMEISCA